MAELSSSDKYVIRYDGREWAIYPDGDTVMVMESGSLVNVRAIEIPPATTCHSARR